MTPRGWTSVAAAAWIAWAAARAEGPAVPRGEALLKTDVMGVFAHPDDETGVAPLVARLALGDGKVVTHVYCTRGEGGGNMVGTQAGASLGVLREAELRDCLARLGVRHCRFLDREDFAYTEGLGITLEKWGHEETLARLVRMVRLFRPEVIVTMNPAPTPGQHGNHQAAGWLAVEAFDLAGKADAFPGQIHHEGLHPWQPRKLFFGGAGPYTVTIPTTNALPGGRTPVEVAGEALSNHRSQAFGNMAASPWLRRPQVLQLVQSVVPFEEHGTDLFAGLPVAGDCPPRVDPPSKPAPAAPVALRFLPRLAVSRYERFVEAHRIGPAAVAFAPDVPVVAGETNTVPLEVVGGVDGGGRIALRAPDGWSAWLERDAVGPATGRPGDYRMAKVRVPEGAGDAVLAATVGEATGTVRLHPVPRLRIPRRDALPPTRAGADDPAWAALPAFAIGPTNAWEGAVRDAADNSAVFRLAHDGTALCFEVRVRDDVVVSNIAPDDIRGHWRSDSVELCVGPAVGAEHTLGTFKAGIFPFDLAGAVRAARDADALPGLVEETAPGMQLASLRTADGYVIRGRLPWSVAGVDPVRTRRIAFNVLVYDGDKADAAPGENINKSRLAWSPRSGVQGRPEDWGVAELE